MHTGIISFADRISHNIKSNDTKDMILNQLYSLYNIKIIQKHYYKIDENNLKNINKNPHLLNLRSNGNPYYIFFTLYNDIPIIYFIDKKVHPGYQRPRIILTRGLFDESLFKNTLLDGEMVKCNDGKWIFLINDIICYEGKHLSNINLPDRLNIIYNMLEYKHQKDETIDVCSFKVKSYYNLYKESISELIKISKLLNYTCRGIYLWSYNLKYKPKLYNFNEENIINVFIKVKDVSEFQTFNNSKEIKNDTSNDIKKDINNEKNIKYENNNDDNIKEDNKRSLWIVKTDQPDVYDIYENNNILNANSIGIALIASLNISKILRIAFKNKNAVYSLNVNCIYNDKFNKWQPIEIINN